MSTFMEKSLILKPLPMTPRDYTTKDPSDEKYQRYVKMSYEIGGMISVPSREEIDA